MNTTRQNETILGLPVEVLHEIFAYLDPKCTLSARQVCRLFGEVGKDHMLDEVVTIYKRDRLQRLVDIAEDTPIAKRIKFFYWRAERFDPVKSFEQWDRDRAVIDPDAAYTLFDEEEIVKKERGIDLDSPFDGKLFKEAYVRFQVKRRGVHSEEEIRHSYSRYVEAVKDQCAVAQEKFDVACMTKFYKACRNLEHVTLAVGDGSKCVMKMTKSAFKDCMHFPHGDMTILDQGVDQFNSLITALHAAEKELSHLSILDVSHRIMAADTHERLPILEIMKPLREFRFGGFCSYDELNDDDAELHVQELREYFNNGELCRWLTAAPNLQLLKLRMLTTDASEVYANTQDVLGDLKWPDLRELGLCEFNSTEDHLVDFLLRHKDTLRILSLSQMNLLTGEWDSVFQRIAGKLTKLQKVKLRLHFTEDFEGVYDFEIPGGESRKPNVIQDAFERYVLRGGEFPDLETLWELEDEMDSWDREQFDAYFESEWRELRKHEEEESRCETDDSFDSEDWDEFDRTI